jgi:hypothetical protein
MQAHIRIATCKEAPGFVRPHVCAIGDYVHYTFRLWKYEVGIPALNLAFTPVRRGGDLVYALPDQRGLTITSVPTGWLFDGEEVHERWPTTQRREMVCGARTFRVKPEDDTLLFDFTGQVPDLVTTIIGFYIYMGNSEGGG